MAIDRTGGTGGRPGSLADKLRDRWSDMDGRRRAAAVGIAVAALAGVVLLTLWLSGVVGGPQRGEDPVALAKFVASPEFAALPIEQKRSYMRRVRKHMKQIEDARRADEIDKRTYRIAYACNWMERKLDDLEDYYKTPATKRQAWLDRELSDGGDSGGGDARPAGDTGAAAAAAAEPTASPDGGLLYDDEEGKAKYEEAKDDFEDEFLQTWTPQGRRQWQEFRAAYKKRRDAQKAKAKPPGPAASRAT